jgi:hypothetical protein
VRVAVSSGPVSFVVTLAGSGNPPPADVVLDVPAVVYLSSAEGSEGEVRTRLFAKSGHTAAGCGSPPKATPAAFPTSC